MNQHIIRTRLLALFVMLSVASCAQVTATSQPSVAIPSPTSIPPTIELPSSTPPPTSTPADTKPVWQVMENWSPANQIRAMLIDQNGDLWTGGPAGIVHWDLKTNMPTVYAIQGDPENTNVVGLSQTSDGIIWAGTFGNGLAKFDGIGWKSFTTEQGLPGNYIVSQTVTSLGELWFSAQKDQYHYGCSGCRQDSYHFVRFDGNSWNTEFNISLDHLVTLLDNSIVGIYNPAPVGGRYFSSYVMIFDGQKWNGSDVYPDGWVNAITVAPDGVMWLATNNTVYYYMNQKWATVRSPWVEKDFQPVSSMAVSKDGLVWVGFSHRAAFDIDRCGDRATGWSDSDGENGVYRYNGKIWMNFTSENGLINNKICAITIDANDTVWLGSFDKGVSRFDGKEWMSYVIP